VKVLTVVVEDQTMAGTHPPSSLSLFRFYTRSGLFTY